MIEFVCQHCGSYRLGYQSYVRCIVPVEENQNGNYIYAEPKYDDIPHIDLPMGFCCLDCGRLLSIYGVPVQCESDLQKYSYFFSAEKKEFRK